MVRGTFGNIRLRNQILDDEGDWTIHFPSGEKMRIFEASELYQKEETPLIVIAGKEYGTGSSRDWAAKGPALLGVKVVIAESFERIHRSNLVGMGIVPLQFQDGDNFENLRLDGSEHYDFFDLEDKISPKSVKSRDPVKKIQPDKPLDEPPHGGFSFDPKTLEDAERIAKGHSPNDP